MGRRNAAAAGVDLIAIEAGKTLVLGKDELLQECIIRKISVISLA